MREIMAAFGRMVRRIATTTDSSLPRGRLRANPWLAQCDMNFPEVRIAAALASVFDREIGSIRENLSRAGSAFAWSGLNLAERLVSVLSRRLLMGSAAETRYNPLGGACRLHPGDTALFIEGSVDDNLIEDLLFAFLVFEWKGFESPQIGKRVEVVPVYAVLKHLFLANEIHWGPEPVSLRADPRILSLLVAGNIEGAGEIAVHRLRIAGLRPLDVNYSGGCDPQRLAASLLIPVRSSGLRNGVFHEQSLENYA
jgi:CRISPR-associated protein Csx17